MKKFSISRIHTHFGIFRLIGGIVATEKSVEIEYEKVEFMGTDGWCELDLNSSNANAILSMIQSDIIHHVLTQP